MLSSSKTSSSEKYIAVNLANRYEESFTRSEMQKIKDEVTEFDKKTRTMLGLLNKIHSTPATQSTP